MRTTEEIIRGDTPGTEWRLRIHRLEGRNPSAPSVYLQAALHGSELPGTAALHFLLPKLRAAEAEGRLEGHVTVVPFANPIGMSQALFGVHSGRFDHGTRVNFNRDFPLIDRPDPALLPGEDAEIAAPARLKARLLGLSLGHEIVLDLHCDDQGPVYIYIQRELWPAASDLAACLGAAAAVVWDDTSDGAFDEAAFRPYLRSLGPEGVEKRVVSTVELRGEADVSPETARADADGLYRFLVGRGVISDDEVAPATDFGGLACPQDQVEMVKAPTSGALLYHVAPGDRVRKGDPLVDVLADPGMPEGAVTVRAPQDGTVLTRRVHRMARRGEDVLKLMTGRRSSTARPGALET